jgi:hypothetical protein
MRLTPGTLAVAESPPEVPNLIAFEMHLFTRGGALWGKSA